MDFLTKLLQFKPPKGGSPSTSAASASKKSDDSYVKFAREFIQESVENQPPTTAASSSDTIVHCADNSKSLPDLLQPEETYKKQSDTLSETDTADYESAIDSELSSANDSFVTDGTHSPSTNTQPELDISALCHKVGNLYLETPQKPVKSADLSALDTPKVFDLFQGDFSIQSIDSTETSYGSFSANSSQNKTLETNVQPLFTAEGEEVGSVAVHDTVLVVESESCIVEESQVEEEAVLVESSPVVSQETPIQGDNPDGNNYGADHTLDQGIQTAEATEPASTAEPDVAEPQVIVVEQISVQEVQVDEPKIQTVQAETNVQVNEAVEAQTTPDIPVEKSQIEEEVVLIESSPVVLQETLIRQDNNPDGNNIASDQTLNQGILTDNAAEPASIVELDVPELKVNVVEQIPGQKILVDEPVGFDNQTVEAQTTPDIPVEVLTVVEQIPVQKVQVDEPIVFDNQTVEAQTTPDIPVEVLTVVEQIPVQKVQVDEPIVFDNQSVVAQTTPDIPVEVVTVVEQIPLQKVDEPIGFDNQTFAAQTTQTDVPVEVGQIKDEIVLVESSPVVSQETLIQGDNPADKPAEVLDEGIPVNAAVEDQTTHTGFPVVQEEIPINIIQTDLPVVLLGEATPPKPASQTQLEITVNDLQTLDLNDQPSPNVIGADLPVVEEVVTVQPASVSPYHIEVIDIETKVQEEVKCVQSSAQVQLKETSAQEAGCDLSLNGLKALCKLQEKDLIQNDDFSVRQSLADFLASEAKQISEDFHNSSNEDLEIPDTEHRRNSPISKEARKDILLLAGFGNAMSTARKSDESVPLDVKWLSDSRTNNKDIGSERRSPAPDASAGGDSTQFKRDAQNDSSLNHSEAGPDTAQGSEEVFADSAGFDFLSSISSSQPSRRLGLESLYVKFDPLVSAPPSKSAIPPPPLFHEDKPPQTAAMSTPPKNPALASIERLINISPSPKKMPAPAPVPAVKQEAVSLDSTAMLQELLKIQEVLTEQDKKDQASLAERTRLKNRVQDLEAQLADATHESEKLSKKAAERTQSQQQMSLIMEEYEKTISRLVAEKEHDKQLHAAQVDSVNKEKENALHHLSNIEIAFSDVHKKYERSKTVIDGFRKNEEVLRETLARYEETVRKQDQKYDMLKSHAMSQLESANQELDNVRRSHQAECAKLKAMLKKCELKASSLEEMMEQKQKENLELASICDDLIAKVTS